MLKIKKPLIKLLVTLSVLSLTSCGDAKVDIKDSEWCGDAGELGASCFHTLISKSRELSKEDWDKQRFGMLCTSAKTFGNWKEALLSLCDQSHRCTYEQESQVKAFAKRVEAFQREIR